MNSKPCTIPYTKCNLINLNYSPKHKSKTIDLLKKSIGEYFHDLLVGKDFLDKSYIIIHKRKKHQN